MIYGQIKKDIGKIIRELWGINAWWFIGIGAVLVIGAAVAVVLVAARRRQRRKGA